MDKDKKEPWSQPTYRLWKCQTGFSSVTSLTSSPSTACFFRSTWRLSVTQMRSSSCQTQNDLRPLCTTDCSTCYLYSRISWKHSFLRTVPVCWLVNFFLNYYYYFFQMKNSCWNECDPNSHLQVWKIGKSRNLVHRVTWLNFAKHKPKCFVNNLDKIVLYRLKESWLNWTFLFWKIKVLGAFFFYSCVLHCWCRRRLSSFPLRVQ